MSRSESPWGGKKVTGSLRSKLKEFWGWSTAKMFFHRKGIVSSAHLTLSDGEGTNELSPNIRKLSEHSSQNRYLDGAAATPSSHFGKRTSSTNAHSADAMMRLQKI
jgi:hypothetical protein